MAYRLHFTPPSEVLHPLPFSPSPPPPPSLAGPQCLLVLAPHLGADLWLPSPQCGFPLQASLPSTRPVAPIRTASSTVGAASVMRFGYRAPNRTQVSAAFSTSANFMFCIYRDLTPLWGGATTCRPTLRSLPSLPLPCFVPPILFTVIAHVHTACDIR